MNISRLSGEAIMREVEIGAHEEVGVLMRRASDALSSNEKMWRMVAHGRVLREQASIMQSGLGHGDTVTVLIQAKPVPTVLTNRFGATAELRDDGSVGASGNRIYGGDSRIVQQQLESDVQAIYSASGAFAALKTDGTVVSWGSGVHAAEALAYEAMRTLCTDALSST